MPRLGHKKSVIVTPPLPIVIHKPVTSSRCMPVLYVKLTIRLRLTRFFLLDQDWAADNVKLAMSR
jgi:hypothetical protein